MVKEAVLKTGCSLKADQEFESLSLRCRVHPLPGGASLGKLCPLRKWGGLTSIEQEPEECDATKLIGVTTVGNIKYLES